MINQVIESKYFLIIEYPFNCTPEREKEILEDYLGKRKLKRSEQDKIDKMSDEDILQILNYIHGVNSYPSLETYSRFQDIDTVEQYRKFAVNRIVDYMDLIYADLETIPETYLEERLKLYQNKNKPLQSFEKAKGDINNQHNNIFSNNGYELFSYILKNYIAEERGRYADVSYYYWRMYENIPQFIHQRPEVFKNWFCKTYQENFEKIKTLNEVTDQKGNRSKHYSTALDWFNHQS